MSYHQATRDDQVLKATTEVLAQNGLNSMEVYLVDRPLPREDATPPTWARQGKGSLTTIFECDQILW